MKEGRTIYATLMIPSVKKKKSKKREIWHFVRASVKTIIKTHSDAKIFKPTDSHKLLFIFFLLSYFFYSS